jgi:predicted RNA methylase
MHDAIVAASPWVKRFAAAIPKDGLALDLACGSGRHTALLTSLGHRILAVDQDISAIEPLKSDAVQTQKLDLEGADWPLVGQ